MNFLKSAIPVGLALILVFVACGFKGSAKAASAESDYVLIQEAGSSYIWSGKIIQDPAGIAKVREILSTLKKQTEYKQQNLAGGTLITVRILESGGLTLYTLTDGYPASYEYQTKIKASYEINQEAFDALQRLLNDDKVPSVDSALYLEWQTRYDNPHARFITKEADIKSIKKALVRLTPCKRETYLKLLRENLRSEKGIQIAFSDQDGFHSYRLRARAAEDEVARDAENPIYSTAHYRCPDGIFDALYEQLSKLP